MINNYIKRILKKQIEIGYGMPNYIREPLSKKDITKLEENYSFKFNESFREYFEIIDGVEEPNDDNKFSLTFFPPLIRLISSSKLEYFLNEGAFEKIRNEYEIFEYSPLHFPILYEGLVNCHWVNLDTRDSKYGHILVTTMWGDVNYLYKSISKLFETLCIAYEEEAIFLTEGHLDADFEKFKKIAKRLNPSIDYWNL